MLSAIWEQTPPVSQERMRAQVAALAQLRAEVAPLKAAVEELAQRLGRNSSNSSHLPSEGRLLWPHDRPGLGEQFWGYLVTERWSAYTWYAKWRRQVCGVHLLRDIDAMMAWGEHFREIGELMKAEARLMCHRRHWGLNGTLTHASARRNM